MLHLKDTDMTRDFGLFHTPCSHRPCIPQIRTGSASVLNRQTVNRPYTVELIRAFVGVCPWSLEEAAEILMSYPVHQNGVRNVFLCIFSFFFCVV